MTHPAHGSLRHQECWDLIPWFVNGRLTDVERDSVEEHVRECAACGREIEEQRHLHERIAHDHRVDCVPTVSLQRLWARIDASEAAEAAPVPTSMDIVTPAVRRTVKQPAMRWLAAAVLVEAVGLTLLTGALLATRGAQGPQSAAYRTVTSPAAAREGAVIRAVFARTLTVADMQTLLSESRLSIVAGPTEAGVYTLAPTVPTDRTQVARSLARLRASSGVRFAEPIVEPTGDLAPVSADAPR